MAENKIVKNSNQKPSKMSQNFLDKMFKNITLFFAVIIVVLMVWMVIALLVQSKLSIKKFGFSFITSTEWDPVQELFGALPFIYGTIVSSIIAVVIATPISIGIGIFLTEISNKWVSTIISFMVQILASIPSILYGLWGLFIFIPFIRDYFQKPVSDVLGWFPLFSGAPIGLGMLTAGLILAIMIIPIIAALVVDIIETVPEDLKAGSLALGSTKWEMIWRVVLPYAKQGILGAVIMGLGRALGETMAVTMVIGNRAEINLSLFAPGHSMAAVIANEFNEATGAVYYSSLIEIGLLLFLVTFILNAIARFFVRKMDKV
ncbi:MAG: phosphate ABC transporter permease subunit PstC [Clostridium sp.]|uniref:phosphate ABC transporter permease subunit PstC n=1 Tax=Clostridium sp. TaxID=1506 RepID=UPI003D6D680F